MPSQTGEWITLEQTAKRLKRSPRTLEKWCRDGRLKYRSDRGDDGRLRRFFHAGEVEGIAHTLESDAAQARAPRTAQVTVIPTHRPADTAAVVDEGRLAVKELIAMVRELTERLLEPPYRRNDWLTPRECFLGWGMPARMASELAARGLIAGEPYGKSWRIRRDSLEAYKKG